MPPPRDGTAIRVILVDDYQIVRQGVRTLLEQQDDIEVVADLSVDHGVIAVARAEQPNVIVVEPDTIDGSDVALAVMCDLSVAVPTARILILTNVRDPEEYTRFLVHGALGLVLKRQPSTVLLKAIRKLNDGEVWLERGSTAQLLQAAKLRTHEEREVNWRIRTLTRREREIVAFICQGMRNADVADRLFISEATVRNHVTSILHKLEVTNRFELVVFAFHHHLAAPLHRVHSASVTSQTHADPARLSGDDNNGATLLAEPRVSKRQFVGTNGNGDVANRRVTDVAAVDDHVRPWDSVNRQDTGGKIRSHR